MGKPIGDLRTLVRYPTGYAVFDAEPADVSGTCRHDHCTHELAWA